MSQLSQALILVIQTLGSLYLLIVLLRFILQLVRADFYNPLSQFIVKATHPLLRPMRRIIPSMGTLDISSLILALIVQMVLMALILLIAYGTIGNPLLLLVWALIGITGLFLNIFFWALIISVILSCRAGQPQPGRTAGQPTLRAGPGAVPPPAAEPRRAGYLADLRLPGDQAAGHAGNQQPGHHDPHAEHPAHAHLRRRSCFAAKAAPRSQKRLGMPHGCT